MESNTDSGFSLVAKTDVVLAADGTVTGTVPGRSFVTFVLTK